MDFLRAKAFTEKLVRIAYERGEHIPQGKSAYFPSATWKLIHQDIQRDLNDIAKVLAACMAGKADGTVLFAARRLDREYADGKFYVEEFLRTNIECPSIISNPKS